MEKTLRPEALPFTPSSLDEAQRRAAEKILALMAAAVQRVGPPEGAGEEGPAARALVEPDRERASRIALLSGERGTGKTTVLLTLMDACQKEHPPASPWPQLPAVARQTVWLEPLDMEPLPPSTNLLAAILARVDAAARRPAAEGRARADRRGYGVLEEGRQNDALLKLRRLQTDVALAWEGNLGGRGPSLDPDAYAVEVLRAEQARLSLNDNLSRVLNEVAGLFPRRNPVFVLPVDDFDLNPPRSLELLRFLRAISVPRLFTLVLGDVKVAELIINLQLAGDLAGLARHAGAAGVPAVSGEEVRTMTGELAGHIIRKLVPPGQIVRLRTMTVAEALYYRPVTLKTGPRLLELLLDCPVEVAAGPPPPSPDAPDEGPGTVPVPSHRPFPEDVPPSPVPSPVGAPAADVTEPAAPGLLPKNLGHFVFAPAPAVRFGRTPTARAATDLRKLCTDRLPGTDPGKEIKSLNDEVVALGVYRAQAVFHTSPRRVADLWLALQEVVPAAGGAAPDARAVLDVLGRYCQSAVVEDSQLSPVTRRRLLAALSQEEGGWVLDGQTYAAEPTTEHGTALVFPRQPPARAEEAQEGPRRMAKRKSSRLISTSEDDEEEVVRQIVHVRAGKGWQVRALGVGGTETREKLPRLEDSTAAALMLFQDLLALGPGRAGAATPLLWDRPEVNKPWAVTEWRLDFSRRVEAAWPTPPWASFWEYDLFLSIWAQYLREGRSRASGYSDDRDRLALLVYGWVDAATAVLLREQPLGQSGEADWDELVKRVERFAGAAASQHPWGGAGRDWLIGLGFLLMPETVGDLSEVTNHFANSPALRAAWREVAGEVRRYRQWLFEQLEKNDMAELAQKYREQVPWNFPAAFKVRPRKKRGQAEPNAAPPPPPAGPKPNGGAGS